MPYFFLQSKLQSKQGEDLVVDFKDGQTEQTAQDKLTKLIVYPKKTLQKENIDNQLVEFDFSGTPPYFFITNKLGGVIDGQGAVSGTRLIVYRRKVSGTDNQLWSLDPLDATETYYYITSKDSRAGVITFTEPVDSDSPEPDKRDRLLIVREKVQPPDDHQLWRIVKG